MKYKVVLVEDQYVARQLFGLYLKNSEKYEIVRTLESASGIAELLRNVPVDLILMDILLDDHSNGMEGAARIKKERPGIKIIAMTSMAEKSWLSRARETGIESFWYKESSRETILDVMDRTMNGESVYPDHPPRIKLGQSDNLEFTERELEVLRVMTRGMSNSGIAKKLGISENTVKVHIQHMLDKTGYENRTELAIEARIRGIAVNLDD